MSTDAEMLTAMRAQFDALNAEVLNALRPGHVIRFSMKRNWPLQTEIEIRCLNAKIAGVVEAYGSHHDPIADIVTYEIRYPPKDSSVAVDEVSNPQQEEEQ